MSTRRQLKDVADQDDVEEMPRFPNSLSFRLITTVDVRSERDIPRSFTGRVQLVGDHGIETVMWFDRGSLDDPSPEVPAFTKYRASGAVKQERHYRLGRLHDPVPGHPAVRGFFSDGSLRYAEHFRYGWRHDHGSTAAIRKWRADGSLRTERHYIDDQRVPSRSRRELVLTG